MAYHPYTWVRATEDGTWISRPGYDGIPPRRVIRVNVERTQWQVNRVGIEVEHGLVLGFEEDRDAEYFLNAHNRYEEPRAIPVYVQVGMYVAFWTPADAIAFVRAGKAVHATEEEAMAAFQVALAERHPLHPAGEAEVEIVADEADEAPSPAATKAKRGRRKGS